MEKLIRLQREQRGVQNTTILSSFYDENCDLVDFTISITSCVCIFFIYNVPLSVINIISNKAQNILNALGNKNKGKRKCTNFSQCECV